MPPLRFKFSTSFHFSGWLSLLFISFLICCLSLTCFLHCCPSFSSVSFVAMPPLHLFPSWLSLLFLCFLLAWCPSSKSPSFCWLILNIRHLLYYSFSYTLVCTQAGLCYNLNIKSLCVHPLHSRKIHRDRIRLPALWKNNFDVVKLQFHIIKAIFNGRNEPTHSLNFLASVGKSNAIQDKLHEIVHS